MSSPQVVKVWDGFMEGSGFKSLWRQKKLPVKNKIMSSPWCKFLQTVKEKIA